MVNNQMKALEVIERICSDDYCQWAAMEKEPSIATQKLLACYKYSHCVLPKTCYDAHHPWRDALEKAWQDIKEMNDETRTP